MIQHSCASAWNRLPALGWFSSHGGEIPAATLQIKCSQSRGRASHGHRGRSACRPFLPLAPASVLSGLQPAGRSLTWSPSKVEHQGSHLRQWHIGTWKYFFLIHLHFTLDTDIPDFIILSPDRHSKWVEILFIFRSMKIGRRCFLILGKANLKEWHYLVIGNISILKWTQSVLMAVEERGGQDAQEPQGPRTMKISESQKISWKSSSSFSCCRK